MSLIPTKTPRIAKKMFPDYVWDVPNSQKVIYLTFDDGPTEKITHWILATLEQYQAKATFFCIGKNIEKHPDVFLHILNQGHAVGNHTHNHIKGWKTKTKDYLENTARAQKTIQSVLQKPGIKAPNLFRPPYGKIKSKQGKKLIEQGYQIIMWDVISFDWDARVLPETCLKNVTNKASHGSIVVFHDSLKASKNMQYALPKTLDYFSKKGFSFKALGV